MTRGERDDSVRQLLAAQAVPCTAGYLAWIGGLFGSPTLLTMPLFIECVDDSVPTPATRVPIRITATVLQAQEVVMPLRNSVMGGAPNGAVHSVFSGENTLTDNTHQLAITASCLDLNFAISFHP